LYFRWFNYHLAAARHPRTVTNFGKDMKDSENYAVLLNRLAPPGLCDLAVLRKEPDLLARAHSMLEAAGQIGCKKYVSPRDIIEVS
jgi:plastin-1